jgi:hypothetical protein
MTTQPTNPTPPQDDDLTVETIDRIVSNTKLGGYTRNDYVLDLCRMARRAAVASDNGKWQDALESASAEANRLRERVDELEAWIEAYATKKHNDRRFQAACAALTVILGSRNGFLIDIGVDNAGTWALETADKMLAALDAKPGAKEVTP